MEYISKIKIPTAGGVVFLNNELASGIVSLFKESGSITSDYAISDTEVYNGKRYRIYFPGSLNLNSNIFNIFGYQLSQEEANAPGTFEVVYDDDWIVVKILTATQSGGSSVEGTNIITETLPGNVLIDNTVPLTKIETAGDRGNAFRTTIDGNVQEFDAKQVGSFVHGNGDDVVSGIMGGDATIDASGNLIISDGVIKPNHFQFIPLAYDIATLRIEQAELTTLNASPVVPIASPLANQYIKVISASAYTEFGTNQYDTNVVMQIKTSGANVAQFENDQALPSTVSRGTDFYPVQTTTSGETQLILGAPVEITVKTAETANGDGTVIVSIIYAVIDID